MTNDFALAMRQALDHTRAQNPLKATSLIQAALAGKSASDTQANETSDDPTSQSQPCSNTRLAALEGQTIPPAKTCSGPRQLSENVAVGGSPASRTAPRLRRPLGDVVRALRKGRSALGLTNALPGGATIARKATVPPPPLPDGAQFVTRFMASAAGARSYKLYIPARVAGRPRGLVVMLHGCTQDPDDFAVGTNMNAIAETYGLLIAYPAQTASHNNLSCWNWFRPADQRRDAGEPAIIAEITRAIMSEFDLERDQVFVAGLSAGGAMAAVMAETYPDLYAAAGIHSGLAYGVANDVVSAFAAMRGQNGALVRAGSRIQDASSPSPRTIVFHGSADQTVHPSNADRIVATAIAGGPSAHGRSEEHGAYGGRGYTRSLVECPDGTPLVDYWLVHGAGHAWSGGQPGGSYADPKGPSASAEMVRFFLNDTAEDCRDD